MDYPRRFKVISLSSHLLVDILNWCRTPRHALALPITDDIPEDADVVTVHASWESNMIDAVIFHSSFALLEPGETPPRVPGEIDKLRYVMQMKVVDV